MSITTLFNLNVGICLYLVLSKCQLITVVKLDCGVIFIRIVPLYSFYLKSGNQIAGVAPHAKALVMNIVAGFDDVARF